MASHTTKRPVTVVTGFLGSGKTTLLNRMLAHPSMKKTAVLVNEFGKVGLDHHLLRKTEEQTVLLGGGCLCCTIRTDLVNALKDLLDMDQRGEIPRIERVLIETSGLADPAPILFTILNDPVLQHHYYVDWVLVTVDAVNGNLHLDRHPESVKQISVADKIIMTKTDMATPQVIADLARRIRNLNPTVQMLESVLGEVDLEELFPPDEMGYAKTTKNALSFSAVQNNESAHVSEMHSVSLTFDKPLDWTAFGLWLSMLLYARGKEVLRVKGMIDVGEEGPVVLNGVQHIIHPPQHLKSWPSDDRRSHLVFIMNSIHPSDLLASLTAFQRILGAEPNLLETDSQ